MRHPRSLLLLLATSALGSAGCATTGRFKDQPVVWRVDDMRDIAEPEEEEYLKYQYFADIFVLRRLERTMELRDREPAHNTNALDEVPDSSWFTNRTGARALSVEDIRRGPGMGPPRPPLTIIGAKVGGGNAGFIVKDARKARFLIKFDRKENPEMQTGAGAAIGRLFWALGYNVPSDNVFILKRSDLTLDPKATWKDAAKNKHPFTPVEFEKVLETSPVLPTGDYRALASELLPGEAKGGCLPEGTRDDDPNDVVDHEHRRELRGLQVLAAWLGHTDMKQDNTLDMYVEEGGRHFLRHYLIDFGETLGGHHGEKGRDEDGYEHYFDWQAQPRAMVAFGLWKRPWEGRKTTPWLSVGAYRADDFDPDLWREAYPYFPFFEMDESDAYWAAKLSMRIDRPLVQAAVEAGQYTDPAAAAYLVETILARRNRAASTYLERVTPLDAFTIDATKLCGKDLAVLHGLVPGGKVELLDDSDDAVKTYAIAASGKVCLPVPANDEYTVYRLRTVRNGRARPPMEVHFKAGPAARVLGIIRAP